MIGTSALARLVALADQRHWRLALVGDHRQLQAVGRGGLFHELCATGRSHELQRIHRFDAQVGRQPPRSSSATATPAPSTPTRPTTGSSPARSNTTSTASPSIWLDTTADGGTVAITTSTNDHVDAINARGPGRPAARRPARRDRPASRIGGGERAHVGDIIATRRNDRQLTSDDGEPVRNRELWTVTAVHADGSLTVRRTDRTRHRRPPGRVRRRARPPRLRRHRTRQPIRHRHRRHPTRHRRDDTPRPLRRRHPRPRPEPDARRHRGARGRRSPRRSRTRSRLRPRRHPSNHSAPKPRRRRPCPTETGEPSITLGTNEPVRAAVRQRGEIDIGF